jgi:GMP synthase-like glutamine amidotransferase
MGSPASATPCAPPMDHPTKRALVICHEPDGPATQVQRRLVERGFAVDTHLVTADYDRPNDAAPFPNVEAYDLLVPMGSIRSLTDKAPIDSWIYDEIQLVRRAHESGQPVLGVCFGTQIIAEALGGSVEVAPVTELGWITIDEGDSPNPIGPGPWMAWHHDRIVPPPGAEVLARTEHAVQLIRIGRTVGTQFHPEVDYAHVASFLETTSDEYLAKYGTSRAQLLADTAANESGNIAQCHALVDWFLDTVAFPEQVVPADGAA